MLDVDVFGASVEDGVVGQCAEPLVVSFQRDGGGSCCIAGQGCCFPLLPCNLGFDLFGPLAVCGHFDLCVLPGFVKQPQFGQQ